MEPDGTTRITYVPDTAAAIRAMAAKLKKLGENPMFDIPLRVPAPSNERPWHKHTLPKRKKRK